MSKYIYPGVNYDRKNFMNKNTNTLYKNLWNTNLTSRLLMLTNPVLLPLSLLYLIGGSSYTSKNNLSLKEELNDIWNSGPFGKMLMLLSPLGILPAIALIIADFIIDFPKR